MYYSQNIFLLLNVYQLNWFDYCIPIKNIDCTMSGSFASAAFPIVVPPSYWTPRILAEKLNNTECLFSLTVLLSVWPERGPQLEPAGVCEPGLHGNALCPGETLTLLITKLQLNDSYSWTSVIVYSCYLTQVPEALLDWFIHSLQREVCPWCKELSQYCIWDDWLTLAKYPTIQWNVCTSGVGSVGNNGVRE